MEEFNKWAKIKCEANSYVEIPLFNEGEIWWLKFGKNIGSEINGKGDLFLRPVVIFKKFSTNTILCIPISTKIKIGSWFKPFIFSGKEYSAILVDIRSLDARRLHKKIGKLSSKTFSEIKKAFLRLL